METNENKPSGKEFDYLQKFVTATQMKFGALNTLNEIETDLKISQVSGFSINKGNPTAYFTAINDKNGRNVVLSYNADEIKSTVRSLNTELEKSDGTFEKTRPLQRKINLFKGALGALNAVNP